MSYDTPDRIPGMFDGLVAAAEAWMDAIAAPLAALADTLLGVDIVENELLAPGTSVRDGQTIFVHPLDAIHLRFKDDPLRAHDAAIAWILARAAGRVDAALARLDAAMENRSQTDA